MRRALAILLLGLGVAGCASAIAAGRSTMLDGVDLVSMTDDMAAQIGSDADVTAASKDGPMRIVVRPVKNEMTAEIVPSGQAVAFTGRVRVLLSKHAPGRFTWVMNRDAFRQLQARELDLGVDPGPDPDRVQPNYALQARFTNLFTEDQKRRETFYLCVFELTDLTGGTVLWSGSYEVKKAVVRGFLD